VRCVRRLAIAFGAFAALAGLASAATVTGTPRADVLTGTSRADVLDGRAGADTLAGLAGSDVVQGGAGRDVVDAGTGDDRVPAHGDAARDRIRCGPGRDVVTAERSDVVARDCEVVSRQLAVDTTTDPIGQHGTQVEPDTFAFGSTVVAVYQVGRVFSGGAVAIGFATSRDAGTTWKSGLLPGVTDSSPRPGLAERVSDPVIAFDAKHGTWLAATLGIAERTSSYHLYVNRSPDGLTWSGPVSAVSSRTGDLDKEWITCDNGASSPFRGSCYLSYFHVGSGEIRTTTSVDGGLTWSAPVASSTVPPQGIDYNGAQPLVLPDGTLVVVYTAFADPRFGARSEVAATRSADGGATFSAPVRVALLSSASIPAIRTFSLASAEVDAAGRIYVAWEGCPGSGSCSASRVVLSTSLDGISWTPAQSVTAGSPAVDHFLPGLGANPATAGRLALVYHSIPDDCANDSTCAGIDVFQTTSSDGGRTWSKQQRLTPEPIALAAIARTRLGLMLADYVSTSFVRGRPVSVFVLASERVNGRFRQSTFAYR
jgi:BNR repeat-like domain/RTX calcium-binding nonapeptide repeat (4 copies)